MRLNSTCEVTILPFLDLDVEEDHMTAILSFSFQPSCGRTQFPRQQKTNVNVMSAGGGMIESLEDACLQS